MEVIIGLGLLGLFVFLGLKYKSDSFTKQAETRLNEIIDESARHSLELEQRLASAILRAQDADRLEMELQAYRQVNQSVISSDMHEALVAEQRMLAERVSAELEETRKQLDSVKGKQISNNVRLGQISEHIVGLLPDFPLNMKGMRFLGSPIDYVAFDFDKEEIVFIEVKTGDSKLTDKQKKVKEWVSTGKVRFMQIRISDSGVQYE